MTEDAEGGQGGGPGSGSGVGPGTDPGSEAPMAVTRARLLDGSLHRMVARSMPDLRLLSEEERDASLRAVLAARPAGPVWLFGYGSLIWNPAFEFAERRVARIEGWHRSFCLSTPVGRGTPERPGLVLALAPGGSCTGVAFRIAENLVEEELSLVWRREMLAGSYVPHWAALHDPSDGAGGAAFGHGIAFTINLAGPHYVGDLTEAETVRRLSTACGPLGSAAEYLFRTRDGLHGLGIHDPCVDRLADAVAACTPPDATPDPAPGA